MEPAAVPTDMPEMEPVETVPIEVMVLIVVLLIVPVGVPAGTFGSSGAVNDPDSMLMLTLLVVPCPAAMIDEPGSAVPTDMPEILPVDTTPVEVMLLMVTLLIVPEPAVPFSGAVSDPDSVPMLTLEMFVAVIVLFPVTVPVTVNCWRRPGLLTVNVPSKLFPTCIVAFSKPNSVNLPTKSPVKLPAKLSVSLPLESVPPSTVVAVAALMPVMVTVSSLPRVLTVSDSTLL